MIFVVCHNKLTSIRFGYNYNFGGTKFSLFLWYMTSFHAFDQLSKNFRSFSHFNNFMTGNGIILVQQKHWNNLNLTIYIMNDFWVDIWKALRQNCLIVCHDVETCSLEEKDWVVILLLRLHLTDSWHFYCKIVYLQ